MQNRLYHRRDGSGLDIFINNLIYPVYNLSERGIAIYSVKEFTIGAEPFLHLDDVMIKGKVCHSSQSKNPSSLPYIIGIKFITVSNIDNLLCLISRIGD